MALLKITLHGCTFVTLPALSSVKPLGSFIQEFAAITETVPPIPAITIGTPAQK